MLQKVACNATNSGAIDIQGKVFVWGSRKYALAVKVDPQLSTALEQAKEFSEKEEAARSSYEPYSYPVEMFVRVNPVKAEQDKKTHKKFGIHNLLDPRPENGWQIFTTEHISFGAYHAGIICQDMSTPGDLVPLPQGQREILTQLKHELIKMWGALENRDEDHVIQLRQDYLANEMEFQKACNDQQGYEPEANTIAAKRLFGKLGGQSSSKKMQEDVSDRLKIEYILHRTFCRDKQEAATFPFVSEEKMKSFIYQYIKQQKDEIHLNKLITHLISQANQSIKKLDESIRDQFQYVQSTSGGQRIKRQFVNLKELRDQMLEQRCSNGCLFMFGMANEGRLGVHIPGLKEDESTSREFKIKVQPLRLVRFPGDNRVLVKKVQCGSSFTLALTTEGDLYSWGFGKSGSLGLGETSSSYIPLKIQMLQSTQPCQHMTDISCGSSHSLAVDRQGRIYSWGNGQGFRLGHKQPIGENAPRQILELAGKFVKFIEAGDASSACITHDNQVYMWGSGQNGRLGNGQNTNLSVPSVSNELEDKIVAQIVKGTSTTFAILQSGQIYGWGSSKSGKLGFELANDKNYSLPKEVIALKEVKVFQVAAGPFHTLVLSNEGRIYSMGNSKDGKLGIGHMGVVDVELPRPLAVENDIQFYCQQVVQVKQMTYPLFRLYNEYGKLKPVFTNQDIAYEVNQVECGENFQVFMTNKGEAYTCGSNKFGQLGLENDSDQEGSDEEEKEGDEMMSMEDEHELSFYTPDMQEKVSKLNKRRDREEPCMIDFKLDKARVTMVAAGSMHAVAVLEEGALVFSWGKNTAGQLGTGSPLAQQFSPQKIKAFGRDNVVVQVACGESHTVFLTENRLVWTCGSNQFGQLGLASEEAALADDGGASGSNYTQPQQIDKDKLDNVRLIAAGRYHTIAIREQSEGDHLRMDDDEDCADVDHGHDMTGQINTTACGYGDDDGKEKAVVVDVKHDVYAWGRGFQGQLGLKNLKIVQWAPKKVRIRRDPRLQDSEQATRFANIACGEKHTLLLTVAGAIWWAGERTSVGKVDPNLVRKNKFDPRNEEDSYQYAFLPYFEPGSLTDLADVKFKSIASNFNARRNYAISEQDEVYTFGEQVSFTKLDFPGRRYVFAATGKNFQTVISADRLPYSWGDAKNGKLGLDLTPYKKGSTVAAVGAPPNRIEKFHRILREETEVTDDMQAHFDDKYNEVPGTEDRPGHEKTDDAFFEPRFRVQELLKRSDQDLFEKSLIQQDIDLIINFRGCIEAIYEQQQALDKAQKSCLMKAHDAIAARIETFPKPNIEKLTDLQDEIPKQVILNKQMYEVLFTLLQTHPCYLIRWIKAVLRNQVDLFVSHPLAFLVGDTGDVGAFAAERARHMSIPETQIMHDDICYLLQAVFGGLKNCLNNRRVAANIMMIGVKVFEFEVEQSAQKQERRKAIDDPWAYGLDEIMEHPDSGKKSRESTFIRIHRLLFQIQSQNTSFINDLFKEIVKLLKLRCVKYVDGYEYRADPQDFRPLEKGHAADISSFDIPNEPMVYGATDIFDYQSQIIDHGRCELRVKNLINFTVNVLEDVIMKALQASRNRNQGGSNNSLSNEVLLMCMKAYSVMTERSKKMHERIEGKKSDEDTKNLKIALSEAKAIQQVLKALFEPLIHKLQHVKPADIIRIVGMDEYKANRALTVEKKRNNFFWIGDALNGVFSGIMPDINIEAVQPLRFFYSAAMPGAERPPLDVQQMFDYDALRPWRDEVFKRLLALKSKKDMQNFDTSMVQRTVEDALEQTNQVCQVQIRTIVYVHNQLVKFGRNNDVRKTNIIYLDGFRNKGKSGGRDKVEVDGEKVAEASDEEAGSGGEDSDSDEVYDHEMCPLKMIMESLGNQFYILQVIGEQGMKVHIDGETLSKSINLQIRTRIFENYNKIVRCADCNGVVYEDLLPRQRIKEALKMRKWQCGRCNAENTAEISLSCKSCQAPRPKKTLPRDLLFPLYEALDTRDETNQQAQALERLLMKAPIIPKKDPLEKHLQDLKRDAKAAGSDGGMDHELIAVVERFLEKREQHIAKKLEEYNQAKARGRRRDLKGHDQALNEEERRDKIEEDLYRTLEERIMTNMDKRQEHQEILDANSIVLREIKEKAQVFTVKSKQITDMLATVAKNAKQGRASENLLADEFNKRIYSGRLHQLAGKKEKDEGKPTDKLDEDAQKEEEMRQLKAKGINPTLNEYFSQMEKKQNMKDKLTAQKLIKTLEKNRGRREKMLGAFGQFSSFSALQLKEMKVIEKVHAAQNDDMIGKCKYLFYEIKEDLENEVEGGYRVELSFDDTSFAFCGIGANQNNQSILSTFLITNTDLHEMRRIMGTRATISLKGTEFNVFNLVKLINGIKTKNSVYQH